MPYFPPKHYVKTIYAFHVRLAMGNLALTAAEYNDLMQCKKKGFHRHTTVMNGPNIGKQWIYCNDGCRPITLLEATPDEQIELAKIVAEDKDASPCSVSALSTLVKKRKVQYERASKRLAAAIDNMLDVEHASRSVVARSGERVRKADEHLDVVRALHVNAIAALRVAQEAWQHLEELQHCTSDKALCQYLVRAGLATGLRGDQRRLYISAQMKEMGVTGALVGEPISARVTRTSSRSAAGVQDDGTAAAQTCQGTPWRARPPPLATPPTTVTRKGRKRNMSDVMRSEMVDGVEIVYARINGVQTIGEPRESSPEGQARPSKRARIR
ncbi:uncharacterized protein EV420DRAFT_1735977 [Desarmillaria tabescens]|uniref:Uncharacterized protein n=1 Tax=Armillaria tabescens TaxID=1929756 RepID=A0AA39J9M4_ARMTA|nr:uncharacterized protein EV420DRAFT_1735977 [Desarmillaria tabescens]KAK0438715.1 hypothetical protein EV420DRAFT_1735977 [Desarmillaria tabescens]